MSTGAMNPASPVQVEHGTGPVVLALPHSGTWLPESLAARLNPRGLLRADTDWHLAQLYEGLLPEATRVHATFHRYLIDANRDPSGQSLYPGKNTTGLCPQRDFTGANIYLAGQEPSDAEQQERLANYYKPYHEALSEALERVRTRHGFAVLYDCHSIQGELPFLFAGRLPDLNVGTNDGKSARAELTASVVSVCRNSEYTWVANGRFKGGYTTRHYGRPEQGVQAIQMELVQSNYMSEQAPFAYQPSKAAQLRSVLGAILNGLSDPLV